MNYQCTVGKVTFSSEQNLHIFYIYTSFPKTIRRSSMFISLIGLYHFQLIYVHSVFTWIMPDFFPMTSIVWMFIFFQNLFDGIGTNSTKRFWSNVCFLVGTTPICPWTPNKALLCKNQLVLILKISPFKNQVFWMFLLIYYF